MSDVRAQVGEEPPATVADRLRGARRRRFVGRRAELELLRSALADPELPFSVLWVHGLGGVGKTTLLGAFAEIAAESGRTPARLDLRGMEPSPPAFTAELERAAGSDGGAGPAGDGRQVLLLDTFEEAAGLEDWLREAFIPALPAGALVVIAGREGPGEAWRQDPGWRDELRVVSLRNLDTEDAQAFLRAGGVARELHERVFAVTHGHPLALSLLLDVLAQRPRELDGIGFDLGAVPDVVRRLVESFLVGVPSPRHRRALEIASRARLTTLAVLRRAFEPSASDELFAWLRGLSFVEGGPHGVFPHDLVREVIDADLRWRDAGAHTEVHRLVRGDVVARITGTSGRERQRALADLVFLHRGNPAAPAFWDWESLGEVYAEALGDRDGAAIARMVESHEGAESAAIATGWLERQPEAFATFRGRGAEPVGFLAQLSLHDAGADDIAGDPGARAVWAHAHRHAPPRPGEETLVARFCMDREAYQAPSRSFNVVTMRTTQEWVTRPRLSWYYLIFADADAVAPLMRYIDFHRAADADFEVGGRRYAVFARDWRRSDGAAWLELMGERELGAAVSDAAEAPASAISLSRAEFADAVRAALRDLHRPGALAVNPLARARMVRDRGGDAETALRDLLEEAVAALRADPREAKLAHALVRTYLRPAATQEAAAEALGLPFSTYRGHLTRGLGRVADCLWERELYGPERLD